uniref:Uncharacterized protein n=1 Tax=Amphimedon queenslandica TaxID=400682 RepID=A0A1X7TYR0_AMPQE
MGSPSAPVAPIISVPAPVPSGGLPAPVACSPQVPLTPLVGPDDFMRLLNAAVETGIERGIDHVLCSTGTGLPAVTAGSNRHSGSSSVPIPSPMAPLSGQWRSQGQA